MDDTQRQIETLRQELTSLKGEFYRNNFSGRQDFTKYVDVQTRLKVPTLASAPTTCEVGELYVNSGTGKLYVCSSANTWSLVGTQS